MNELTYKIWYILNNEPNKSNDSDIIIPNINYDYYLCNNDVIKLGMTIYALTGIKFL